MFLNKKQNYMYKVLIIETKISNVFSLLMLSKSFAIDLMIKKFSLKKMAKILFIIFILIHLEFNKKVLTENNNNCLIEIEKNKKNCTTNNEPSSYSPVCSSNGTVFDNECLMNLHSNCSLKISDWEECRGLHPLCPADCLDIQDPVCADDNKIYPNKCVMHKRNCGKLIRERPILFCLGNNARKSRQDQCPDNCLELYKPVCGSDGQIYLNECYLKMQNCNNDIEKVDMNECATKSKCPSFCIPIYDPVCGSDKKIYLNRCMMFKENCDNDINIRNMPLQFCAGDDIDKI